MMLISCKGKTKRGDPCQRKIKKGDFCYQHQPVPAVVFIEPTPEPTTKVCIRHTKVLKKLNGETEVQSEAEACYNVPSNLVRKKIDLSSIV